VLVELLDDAGIEKSTALLVGEEVDVDEATNALAGPIKHADEAFIKIL
jgi:hypothetical protein